MEELVWIYVISNGFFAEVENATHDLLVDVTDIPRQHISIRWPKNGLF